MDFCAGSKYNIFSMEFCVYRNRCWVGMLTFINGWSSNFFKTIVIDRFDTFLSRSCTVRIAISFAKPEVEVAGEQVALQPSGKKAERETFLLFPLLLLCRRTSKSDVRVSSLFCKGKKINTPGISLAFHFQVMKAYRPEVSQLI